MISYITCNAISDIFRENLKKKSLKYISLFRESTSLKESTHQKVCTSKKALVFFSAKYVKKNMCSSLKSVIGRNWTRVTYFFIPFVSEMSNIVSLLVQ